MRRQHALINVLNFCSILGDECANVPILLLVQTQRCSSVRGVSRAVLVLLFSCVVASLDISAWEFIV